MSRTRLVIGNWKMNPASQSDAVALARTVAAIPRGAAEVGVAPPAIALAAVSEAVRGSGVGVYAQDVHWEDKGAYTGQLSVAMLRGLASGAIVGHSEVRRDQGDDDARVAKKLARVLAAGLRAVLCVGETEAQFAAGETESVLRRQIERDLAEVAGASADGFVVAYEPVWAIGTGDVATPQDAQEAAEAIRDRVSAVHGRDVAAGMRILYGGSVKSGNIAVMMAQPAIDGALVGGASLDAGEFVRICRYRELAVGA